MAFSRHMASRGRATWMRGARQVASDTHTVAEFGTTLEREGELRRAIERGEFEAFFQPIIALNAGTTAGFEALVRWRHPRHGMVAPAQFMPLAEGTDLIVAIDRWMLRAACEQLIKWDRQSSDHPRLCVSVNISGAHLVQPDFIAHLEAVIGEMRIDPARLHVEITEEVLIEQTDGAANTLGRLREIGVRIALDDFGAGYLSLDNLRRFPIETVKIDRTFIQGDGGDATGMAIIRGIASRAHSLSMQVVAEGIEHAAQIALLLDAGCDFGQGYYFSRPIPSSDARR